MAGGGKIQNEPETPCCSRNQDSVKNTIKLC